MNLRGLSVRHGQAFTEAAARSAGSQSNSSVSDSSLLDRSVE